MALMLVRSFELLYSEVSSLVTGELQHLASSNVRVGKAAVVLKVSAASVRDFLSIFTPLVEKEYRLQKTSYS